MPALDPSVPVYPIGVAERLTGLSARQIRYYEKEGLLAPSRTRGNRRLFSPADVERLRQVKALMVQGLNVEGVRAYLGAARGESPTEGERIRPVGAAPRRAPGERAGGPTVVHPAILRQARGRRLSSLFPVDHQDELVRWLEEQRQ